MATDFTDDNHKAAKDEIVHRPAPATEKTIRDKHLANITVTSFYCQTAIEQLAAKVTLVVSSAL